MKFRYLVAMTASLSISVSSLAADKVEALFTASTCNNCHAAMKDMIGPSIKAVAAKYKGNKDAQAMLEKKVREGGTGTWGALNMPATPATISDEQIKSLVAWMLAPAVAPATEPKEKEKIKESKKEETKPNKKTK